MKKILLALTASLFSPSIVYADACPEGEAETPIAGCTIDTSDTRYKLTGNIASAVTGIHFTTDADNNSLSLKGDIDTTGSQYGLHVESSKKNTTTIDGNMITRSFGRDAVFLDVSNRNTTNIIGDISTMEGASAGLYFYYSNGNTTTVTGDINTIEFSSGGLYLYDSSKNVTTINGDIITGNELGTTGGESEGVQLEGSDNNRTMITGDISTTGEGSEILLLDDSDYNITIIKGNLSSAANESDGVVFTNNSDHNSTTITGNIDTTGIDAEGLIFVVSSDNRTTINGNITTTKEGSDGLRLFDSSNNNSTTINGDISTEGDEARGLYFTDSDNNSTKINGDISTGNDLGSTGIDAQGLIFDSSSDNRTTINGNITTTANGGDGVRILDSSNNRMTINGNITTKGDDAPAVYLTNSDDNRINLHGSVTDEDLGTNTIYINSSSDNNIIAFGRGSTFVTDYYNSGSGNILDFTNLGAAASYNYDWTNAAAGSFLVTDANKPVISGSAKSRGVADMDDAGNRLYQRFSQINRSLTKQHRRVEQGNSRGLIWMDTYYSDSERDTNLAEIKQDARGVTIGFNASNDSDLAMDVVLNFEKNESRYGLSEQAIESNSVMLGLSFPQLIKTTDGSLAVKFLVGLSDNDSDLKLVTVTPNVSQQETITDEHDSYYLNAGAAWMQGLAETKQFQHSLLLGMDVVHERIEGSSASAYYKLSDRNITQLVAQAQYGMTFTSSNERLQINGDIGVAQANIIAGEKQNYSIDGTAVSYSADKKNTYYSASLGLNYQLTESAHAYVNVQRFDSSDDIDGKTANVGLNINF